MLSDEDELIHALGMLLTHSPSLVNSAHPDTGTSLLHFAVQHTNQPRLMQLLLECSCSVGLGCTIGKSNQINSTVKLAITHGKLSLLQSLLEAARSPQFANTPAVCELLSMAFKAMTLKYPQTFLDHIEATELQRYAPEGLAMLERHESRTKPVAH